MGSLSVMVIKVADVTEARDDGETQCKESVCVCLTNGFSEDTGGWGDWE